MIKRIILSVIFAFGLFGSFVFGQLSDQNAVDVMHNMQFESFFKHVRFLSSDKLEGRDTGSKGFAKAADYVASEFKSLNLEPFGDDYSYFQKVGFTKRGVVPESIDVEIANGSKSVECQYGENISLLPSNNIEKVRAKQSMVFVGYGNILPKDNINDYEGVDVKGKTAIIAMGGPKGIKSSKLYDPIEKVNNAVYNGASGILLYYPGRLLQKLAFNNVHGFLSEDILSYTDTSVTGAMTDFDLEFAVYAKRKVIKKCLKQNKLNLAKEIRNAKKKEQVQKELNSTLACSYDVEFEKRDCKNVVAVLEGSDPVLKNEYVVLTAHLDHLGIGKPVKGDSIYNGMWDNATGSAAVLSIAKAFTELPFKPKRSVIFVCLTGEEKGILGSNFFVQKYLGKEGKMIANINIDMVGNLFDVKDVIPMGYSHSNLSEAVDFAAKHVNLAIDDNKKEEYNYITRSDQIAFIKKGIPALNIGTGYNAVDPKINAYKATEKWMKKYYHSPQDDLNQSYTENGFMDNVKFNFLTAYFIAQNIGDIKWNEEGWLYKRYLEKEEK